MRHACRAARLASPARGLVIALLLAGAAVQPARGSVLRPAADLDLVQGEVQAEAQTEADTAIIEVRGRRLRIARVPRSRGGAGLGRIRAPRNPMTSFRFRQKPSRF